MSFTETAAAGPLLLALAVSVLAGLVSFASPCVVPLVPGYLSYLAAVVGVDESDNAPPNARWRVTGSAALFVAGFTVVFLLGTVAVLGMTTTLITNQLVLQRVGGALTIVMGLVFVGYVPALQRQLRFAPRQLSTLAGAPLLGAVFALGWTPCLGPTLAGVVTVASATDGASVARGIVLVIAYCVGLGIPFVLLAFGSASAVAGLDWLRRHSRALQIFGGVLLIVVGVTLVSGRVERLRVLAARRVRVRGEVADLSRLLAWTRNTWRALTSMGTALVLLFLLALGAMPGALLPQRSLNAGKVDDYLAAHPKIGPWLDKLQAFNVFGSFWFTAIYTLLFISLLGCLTPRMIEHARSMRATPVPAPRNLARLPKHGAATVAGEPDDVATTIAGNLRGWRTVIRRDEGIEISAEKGYLREFGNLVFHFSLLGLLVAVAAGKLFGYEGNVVVIADGGPGFCSASPAAFDSFRAGNTVDGTSLHPICLRVNDFQAKYLPSGQATSFAADIDYQSGRDLTGGSWRPYRLEVNHPLRVGGDRVYLQGHGYAPTFSVTFPDGQTRTSTVQWRPDNARTLLSSGVARIDPPAGTYPDAAERRKHQIAITGSARTDRATRGHPAVVEFSRADRPSGRRRHLFRRHRPGHRSAAVAVLPGSAPHRPAPAQPGQAGQPARRRAGADRPGAGGGHRRAFRRRGAVRQSAGLARPGPDLGAGVRDRDDGRAGGVAAGASAPGLGSAYCRQRPVR